jgi:hypothetical protein
MVVVLVLMNVIATVLVKVGTIWLLVSVIVLKRKE